MRMWKVEPGLMCDRHLLGEHLEIHMFAGCLRKGKSLKGYIRNGLLEVHNLRSRHQELVIEMGKRGFCHRSPLLKYPESVCGRVDKKGNLKSLSNRCKDCRTKIHAK